MSSEAQIQADIEALRCNVTNTQDLYREVCTVLFFRYGITPTANKLYQYVRKGSMSAPAEALAKFWEDMREKSRVRIEHPDLPETVRTAAGDMVAALWTQAQAAAQEGLATFRSEAEAAMLQARSAQASAEDRLVAAVRERDSMGEATQVATERALQLERDLAAERASKEEQATQLQAACGQQSALEKALVDARRDFAGELEKLRDALQRAEERCEAAEKRALLEIDRERTAAAKAAKELATQRQANSDADARHREEVAQLQRELGEARQRLGVAEGKVHEMRIRNQELSGRLDQCSAALNARETENAVQQCDLAAHLEAITTLEQEIQKLRNGSEPKAPKPRRPRRATEKEE